MEVHLEGNGVAAGRRVTRHVGILQPQKWEFLEKWRKTRHREVWTDETVGNNEGLSLACSVVVWPTQALTLEVCETNPPRLLSQAGTPISRRRSSATFSCPRTKAIRALAHRQPAHADAPRLQGETHLAQNRKYHQLQQPLTRKSDSGVILDLQASVHVVFLQLVVHHFTVPVFGGFGFVAPHVRVDAV